VQALLNVALGLRSRGSLRTLPTSALGR